MLSFWRAHEIEYADFNGDTNYDYANAMVILRTHPCPIRDYVDVTGSVTMLISHVAQLQLR